MFRLLREFFSFPASHSMPDLQTALATLKRYGFTARLPVPFAHNGTDPELLMASEIASLHGYLLFDRSGRMVSMTIDPNERRRPKLTLVK